MAEKIYTIPLNEAFDKTLESETPDCPLCLMRRMLEKNELDRIMGAAMMEPDVRIETNKKGFCRKHFDMMTGGGGSRLPLALMLESHIAETEKEIFSGGTLFDGKGLKEEEKLKKLDDSCYVCSRTEDAFSKMLGTVIYLWENEEEFREKYKRQTCFCLPHYKLLLSAGRNSLQKKQFGEFFSVSREIMQKYIRSLGEDVSWFCKKFDYRYDSEPWYNAKGSVPRAINFLCGGVNSEEK